MSNIRLDRREFLKAAAAGASALAFGGLSFAGERSSKRPNVILVMTDDQGYGDLACSGNDVIKTPNMDKLYGQSVRLTDYHVGPTCSPTRASLLTGRYCNRTGVWHTIMGRSLLRADEVTAGDVFSAAGYRTGMFGKWHLGDNYPFRPQDRGFDDVLYHKGGGVGNAQDWWGNDYYDDTYFRGDKPEKQKGYCTDVWFDEAIKFVEKNRRRPFFLYLPTNSPHGPYLVPDKYKKPYEDKDVHAAFYGMITNIDENLGRLMVRLEELGLAEDTILIFTTDNGTAAGAKYFNAKMRGQKGSEYDGGHRVPLFIRWPGGGLGGGIDVEKLTAHIDIMPMLIELCGIEKPAGVKFDGTSIVKLLRAGDSQWPERVLVTDSQRLEHPKKWRKCAVMTEKWRLVNGRELYDIKADPGQKDDIAERYPQVVERLRGEYDKWWADVSQTFDVYCDIIIGSDKENPTTLSSHDWHEADNYPVWHQKSVASGQIDNGFWTVEVARAGRYEFALRRWPKESGKKTLKTKEVTPVAARLRVGDVEAAKPVDADSDEVVFTMKLKKQKAVKVKSWLIGDDGNSFGAYYVYVKRL